MIINDDEHKIIDNTDEDNSPCICCGLLNDEINGKKILVYPNNLTNYYHTFCFECFENHSEISNHGIEEIDDDYGY